MTEHPATWFVFGALVLTALALDLGVFHRQSRVAGPKAALAWSAGWIGLALLFNAGIYCWHGGEKALQFFTGYLVEFSLSVDNLFVFLLLFSYFNVPNPYRHKVLFWGIIGALLMRGVFIIAGVTLLEKFHWIIYLFGALLVASGFKMAWQKDKEARPERNPVLKVFRRIMPVATDYGGNRFFIRQQGRWFASPLLVVLLMLESTDLVFAVDSVPAVLAITRDPFIVYTSNAFAVLGLRSMFFVLEGVLNRFRYLHYGLAAVLVFVGLKMLLAGIYEIPTWISLVCIANILTVAVMASWLHERAKEKPAAGRHKMFPRLNDPRQKLSNARMRRMVLMLVLCLLAVGQTAGAQSFAKARGAMMIDRPSALSATEGRNQPDWAGDILLVKHPARHGVRRIEPAGEPDGKTPPTPGSFVVPVGQEPASSSFSVAESPADLPRCWQFILRLASEPRAPSPNC